MCGPDWRTNCGVGGGGRRAWKNIFIYFSSFQIFWGLAICNVIVKTLSNLQAVSQKVAALGRSIGVSPTNVRKGIVGGPEMITSGMSHHREAKLSRTIKGSEYISDRPWLFGQLATSNPKDWAWLLSPSVNRRPDVIICSMAFLNYFKGVVRQKKLRRTTNNSKFVSWKPFCFTFSRAEQ